MQDLKDFRVKYRPNTLDEFLGNDHIKIIWNSYIKKGFFPRSIILPSNYGMGKTTLARILAADITKYDSDKLCFEPFMEFDSAVCDFAYVHKMIRDRCSFNVRPRVFFFDEAQRMPDKAQDGFLKIIEDFECVTFIFATTDSNKIDGGIWSRSDRFFLKTPSPDILTKELTRISEFERIKIEKSALDFLIELSGCIPRECLGNLQTLSHYRGVIDSRVAKEFLAH